MFSFNLFGLLGSYGENSLPQIGATTHSTIDIGGMSSDEIADLQSRISASQSAEDAMRQVRPKETYRVRTRTTK